MEGAQKLSYDATVTAMVCPLPTVWPCCPHWQYCSNSVPIADIVAMVFPLPPLQPRCYHHHQCCGHGVPIATEPSQVASQAHGCPSHVQAQPLYSPRVRISAPLGLEDLHGERGTGLTPTAMGNPSLAARTVMELGLCWAACKVHRSQIPLGTKDGACLQLHHPCSSSYDAA